MYTPYEGTIISAEKKDILLLQERPGARFSAKALRLGTTMAIFIDESAYSTETERRYAFVHEIAHCETGSFYKEGMHEVECMRMDYRANKYTVLHLVPFELYKNTILAGKIDEWEQAEAWDVPQRFVSVVHRVYTSTRWDDVQRLRQLCEVS